MENLSIYNAFRSVPKDAQKTITGGKLKGFTDINPMWRIKSLTETFGAAGFGWYIDQVEKWVEEGNNDKVVFVKLNLYVKVDDEWSKPIVGIGGSKLETFVNGKNGNEGYYDLSDEAYKMAFTDAISIACKNLGMAADIYYAADRTKYDSAPDTTSGKTTKKTSQKAPALNDNYIPMDEETYWKVVAAYAEGKPTKTGGNYKDTWIATTHADANAIAKFDNDVENYMIAHS